MGTKLEIERKYLLNGMPVIPSETPVEVIRIEQGYLPPPGAQVVPPEEESSTWFDGDAGALLAKGHTASDVLFGRLRRETWPDGRTRLTHTIKIGEGLVREERENELSPDAFAYHWRRTAGRRLSKTRHRVATGLPADEPQHWEIDEFPQLGVILLEVELPDPGTVFSMPPWLSRHVVREVTNEPAFRNSALAIKAANTGTAFTL